MHVIDCPSLPYWDYIPDGVHPGTTIHIDGFVPHHCDKLELNLMTGHEIGHHAEKHSNIALQLRTKMSKKKLICNSRQCGRWEHKEKHHIHHLHHSSHFNITIIVEQQFYRIICNGQNVCNFTHRLPYHEVRILYIEGHVKISRIEYRHGHQQMVSSVPYPTAPVYAPTQTYPTAPAVYPTAPAVYPAAPAVYPPPAYIPAPVVQPMPYMAPTVIIEESHHHGHHHHGFMDTLFGHHHHDHHHHGHHGHHHHHH